MSLLPFIDCETHVTILIDDFNYVTTARLLAQPASRAAGPAAAPISDGTLRGLHYRLTKKLSGSLSPGLSGTKPPPCPCHGLNISLSFVPAELDPCAYGLLNGRLAAVHRVYIDC